MSSWTTVVGVEAVEDLLGALWLAGAFEFACFGLSFLFDGVLFFLAGAPAAVLPSECGSSTSARAGSCFSGEAVALAGAEAAAAAALVLFCVRVELEFSSCGECRIAVCISTGMRERAGAAGYCDCDCDCDCG